jgi:hypothetical protein
LQNNFDHLFGTGNSLDDLTGRQVLDLNSLIHQAIAQGRPAMRTLMPPASATKVTV